MALPVPVSMSRWAWQATDRLAFVAKHIVYEHQGGKVRVGVDYNLDVAQDAYEFSVNLSWALFVWAPIFMMLRVRLFPIRARDRTTQYWESFCQLVWALADAFVMTVASDSFAGGEFFGVMKGMLMVFWFIWAYDEMSIRQVRARFV
ncbi:hypothetical protein F5B19DRAFT_479009 [Rostrohypoxylon terebratum]|nr:hypothetical protein F5B19DRAFT_479009 [Rostrohypoxylon terebratum]